MKRNTMIVAGIALVLALFQTSSWAQNDTPAPPAAPAPAPVPNAPPTQVNSAFQPVGPGGSNQPPFRRPMPPPRARPTRLTVQRAVSDLQMAKMSLQNEQGDIGGHKESAIAACEKALEELQAVMKALPAPVPPQRGAMPPTGGLQAQPPPAPVPPSAPPAQPAPQP